MDKQPETKFLHFRFREKDGNIFARGGRTIAFQETPDGVKYAVALCHLNDNFVKRQGRIKAGGRLNSPKFSAVFPGTEDEFLTAINSDIQLLNVREKQAAAYAGYDPDYALQLERKFNGKRKGVVLTEGDALADLNGTPRPDNATVKADVADLVANLAAGALNA